MNSTTVGEEGADGRAEESEAAAGSSRPDSSPTLEEEMCRRSPRDVTKLHSLIKVDLRMCDYREVPPESQPRSFSFDFLQFFRRWISSTSEFPLTLFGSVNL